MCLITTTNVPSIAEEDIIVYKLLYENLKSICQDFPYKRNVLYALENIPLHARTNTVNRFIHCDDRTFEWARVNSHEKVFYVEEGFHSALYPKRFEEGNWDTLVGRREIFKAVIPKGSFYFKDPTGFIVSDRLMIL